MERTQSMTGRTESMTFGAVPARGLSTAARAARSLAEVRRLPEGSAERSAAMGRHLATYATRPRPAAACRISR